MAMAKERVAYFYDPDVGQAYFGQGHPMKPHRVRMAHALVLHYGLYAEMDAYRPHAATEADVAAFHADDYVAFLATVAPDGAQHLQDQLRRYNMYEDCPVFDGLWAYARSCAGGSLGAAVALNRGAAAGAGVAIHWAGGMHHAKRAEASGFCYVNDIVLAILELLKHHARVLYVDIDVHHGDGVEEAFLTTDRVMTVSFHKYGGGFFPGTGDVDNRGHGRGAGYALNVPLADGITDEAYASVFEPVMAKVVEVYRPEAIVLQCGADSLAGDRLGCFNLSSAGHAACVAFCRRLGLPLMLLGGGGYRIASVARCWAAETGVALGRELPDELPPNEYLDYYGPDFRLGVAPRPGVPDRNARAELEALTNRLLGRLASMAAAPGVAFHERPPDAVAPGDALARADGAGGDRGADALGGGGRQRLWDGGDDGGDEPARRPGAGGGGAPVEEAGGSAPPPAAINASRDPRQALASPAPAPAPAAAPAAGAEPEAMQQ